MEIHQNCPQPVAQPQSQIKHENPPSRISSLFRVVGNSFNNLGKGLKSYTPSFASRFSKNESPEAIREEIKIESEDDSDEGCEFYDTKNFAEGDDFFNVGDDPPLEEPVIENPQLENSLSLNSVPTLEDHPLLNPVGSPPNPIDPQQAIPVPEQLNPFLPPVQNENQNQELPIKPDQPAPDQPAPVPVPMPIEPPSIEHPPENNILLPMNDQAVIDIKNYFENVQKDDPKTIRTAERFYNMMQYIKDHYTILENSFEINFVLDGEPDGPAKIEPYYIKSEEFYKANYTARIEFKTPGINGQPEQSFYIECKREIFSLIKDPDLFPDYAKAGLEQFRNSALSNISENYVGSIHYQSEEEKKASLKLSCLTIEAKKDSTGKARIIEGISARNPENNQLLKFTFNEQFKREYVSEYGTRFENTGISADKNYQRSTPYRIHLSDPSAFIQSPHVSTHLKRIKEKAEITNKQFEKIQSEFITYVKGKFFGKTKQKKSRGFKKLLADLSINENQPDEIPKSLSKDTNRYLQKKEELKKLQNKLDTMIQAKEIESIDQHTDDVRNLLDQLKKGGMLIEAGRTLLNLIAAKNKDLIEKLKKHPDVQKNNIGENDERFKIVLVNSYLMTRTKLRLDQLAQEIRTDAIKINEKNQELFNQLYQIKDFAMELEAHVTELVALKNVDNLEIDNKEVFDQIKNLISDLKIQIDTYSRFTKTIEDKLKSVPRANPKKIVNIPEKGIVGDRHDLENLLGNGNDQPNEKVDQANQNEPKIGVFRRLKGYGEKIKERLNKNE